MSSPESRRTSSYGRGSIYGGGALDESHPKMATVASCNLNQWALDFDGNFQRILRSIMEAKSRNARYRTGPELEVTGYGCEDHFLEMDTFEHSWDVLAKLLRHPSTKDILFDVGMPILHRGTRYNTKVFCLNQKILLIRPKMFLADDGNYRESRYFTSWSEERVHKHVMEDCYLPSCITAATGGQKTAPIGVAIVQCRDASVATETCEELFTPQSPHIWLGLNGADIISNGSGSHHQLRKLNTRVDLIRSATSKGGGVYVYANHQGCDGGRLYFDGCSLISVNGNVVEQASQFSLNDVEVISANVDLDEVRSYRAALASRGQQSRSTFSVPLIETDYFLCTQETVVPTPAKEVFYHSPEEEIAFGPAAWLWDYLRRSGAGGYLLPLSGGADSSSTATIVGVMSHMVVKECERGNEQVLKDAQRIAGEEGYRPSDPKEFTSRIFHTCYMGTSNSSEATKLRASNLAKDIGSYHLTANIDAMVSAVVHVLGLVLGHTPKYLSQGGSFSEDIALQNIQARLRMVFAYLLAQLLPWARSKQGFLLVLGSANVDEALRGYMTKYDCSSADINPIGGIAKLDLKKFLYWAGNHKNFNYSSLKDIVVAPPTAELRPYDQTQSEHSQADEDDMGMTYEELGWFGRLRKLYRCGPVSMFRKLISEWGPGSSLNLSPSDVATKVKRFFKYYSINRHKMTVLTPSYHAEQYSPDDNRFDLRPFLYDTSWSTSFRAIDKEVEKHSGDQTSSRPIPSSKSKHPLDDTD